MQQIQALTDQLNEFKHYESLFGDPKAVLLTTVQPLVADLRKMELGQTLTALEGAVDAGEAMLYNAKPQVVQSIERQMQLFRPPPPKTNAPPPLPVKTNEPPKVVVEKPNPKYWAYVQAMPRERLERTVVLNEVRELDRQQRIREGVMKQINRNPEMKRAYDLLVTRNKQSSFGDSAVQIPLWWIPKQNWVRGDSIFLFDSRSASSASELRMLYARVFVHFAEKILTIDELKRPPPKRLELQT